MYPTIAIGAMVQTRYSTMRPHIDHPYIYDKYNHTEGNIGLGFVWRFQSFRAAAKRDEARAKAQKLRAKKRFARLGISLQTHKVYVDLKQALSNLKDTKKQLKLARRWAVSARSGYEAGTTEAEDLLKAMAAYLNYRIQFYRGHYRAHVLQAEMGKTLGRHSAFLVGSPQD
jgi:outer membrane protein TolC